MPIYESQETIIVTENVNKAVVSTPGPQGPAGKTILNGIGVPASNLGRIGDFYYDTSTYYFYGPKIVDSNWTDVVKIKLATDALDFSWSLQMIQGPTNNIYSVDIYHNLGFYPNVTVKSSAGDILETGIDYNSINQITLTMAQPFSGTAYLS